MKNLLLVLSIACLVYSCKDKKETDKEKEITDITTSGPKDSLLITDSSWGLIQSKTDFETLKKLYGESNVKDETICGPECVDSIDVTIVYPNTLKEITVYWEDSFYHKSVMMAESNLNGAPYHTADGLKNGTTLRELLKINGNKRLTFSGFGWDYGGFLQSFREDTSGRTSLAIRLDLSEHTGQNELYGDTMLHTDMPVVQKNLDKIIVVGMTKSFLK